ncbi:MAG: GWxTD domain-containing protein [Acidobacteriota bacterium]|jgi:GWxTD domain-containing protein|nr:GWxTD domain-containing protein [Acidobacteriota bacterium]
MPQISAIKTSAVRVVFVLFVLLGVTSCSRLQRMENQMPAADREFIQEVRYIITSEERKRYVSLSADERVAFQRDFWKRRDPSPDTERNEYKEIYFSRVREANRLFRSEGREGWLSDRGRVYVLLGPPDHRQVYPMGYSFYEPPVEVWNYGFFPIIFVDRYQHGKYEMVKANAYYLNAVARAQIMLNEPQQAMQQEERMDFELETRPSGDGAVQINVMIPYRMLLFTRKADRYEAEVMIRATLNDTDKKQVWIMERTYPFSITEKELATLSRGYAVEFQADAETSGDYLLTVRVGNKGEEKVFEKSKTIRVR